MLILKNVNFGYFERPVITNVTLEVSNGETVAIVGESGCGKSTLLKLIYGLYDLNSGEISHNRISVLGPKYNLIPGFPTMKYLSQDFDLMPFTTVSENVGKFLSNIYKDKKSERIFELLKMVEMTDFADVKVVHLSGGQQQRVALARVLALEPEVLLLDEPFSQIDVFRRNKLRRNLFNYIKDKKITCLIATHDSSDVLAFADNMIVLQEGEIIRKGIPKNVYQNPEILYVASLFGEVNEISNILLEKSAKNNNKRLVYPQQLKIADHTNLMITVRKSYLQENSYLVEADYIEGTLFFESEILLKKKSQYCLELKR